jgi:ribosomal protein L37E
MFSYICNVVCRLFRRFRWAENKEKNKTNKLRKIFMVEQQRANLVESSCSACGTDAEKVRETFFFVKGPAADATDAPQP